MSDMPLQAFPKCSVRNFEVHATAHRSGTSGRGRLVLPSFMPDSAAYIRWTRTRAIRIVRMWLVTIPMDTEAILFAVLKHLDD